jgi:hypothetical protein
MITLTLTEKEKEILFETISFYNLSNRGYDKESDSCEYLSESGHKCAVGRCMNEETLARKDISQVTVGFFEDDHGNIDHIFQDRYKGCRVIFWDYLQTLHDNESNWNETGLSDMGKKKANLFFNITV